MNWVLVLLTVVVAGERIDAIDGGNVESERMCFAFLQQFNRTSYTSDIHLTAGVLVHVHVRALVS